MEIKEGIYFDIPFSEYHAWEAVSSHFLWTLKTKSPCHANWDRNHPEEPTDAFMIGQALHVLTLEPEHFEKRYVVGPDVRANTIAWKEAEATAITAGKIILKAKDYTEILGMKNAFAATRVARYVQKGKAEVSLVWRDEKTGILCKSRLDYVRQDNAVILDLKTSIDASPGYFARACYNFGYHHQAAMYSDAYKIVLGDFPAFVFVVIEKDPPYVAKAYEVHEDTIAAGRQSYRAALETCAECMTSGIWPAYGDDVEMLNLPEWALKKEGVNQYQIQPE